MSRPHVLGPAEQSALRDLELLARTTVEGLRQGLHRSPFHGYNAEFSQYRHYRQGDDLKYVDWKAFARTDRLYSRQFRETTNLGATLLVDVSRSMAYPAPETGRPSKWALARAAAAALATLVIDQGDGAGLLAVRDDGPGGTQYLPARSGRHHLRLLLAALARLSCTGAIGMAATLERAGALLRRRGLLLVFSDFYDEEAALHQIRRLARMGHDVIVLHVLAAEEIVLPSDAPPELEDLETGERLLTDARAVRAEYGRRVAAFLAHVQRSVAREGLDYVRLVTGQPLEPALRRLLVRRRTAP